MDSLQFSPTDYNDDKAPRTPSPPTSAPAQHGQNYKQDMDNSVHIFNPDHDANDAYQWGQSPASNAVAPVPRPSLLQELYDSDGLSPEHSSPPEMYVDNNDWSPNPPPAPAPHTSPHQRPADYTLIRRATLPYARQERPEGLGGYPPFLPPHAAHHHGHPHAHEAPMYANEMPLSAEPAALHGDTYSPPGYGGEFDHDAGVKLEDGHHLHHYPPPGAGFYRGVPQHPHMHPHLHPAHHPHMAPHHGMHGYAPHGIAVQHTDDAASKETQYLRRRCFNCHTTEPPSWRRSTLNPGKIVCNKCGLYERTHLRPRPLRFDELRAGNKARKGAAAAAAAAKGSPKAQVTNGVKKAPGLVRRSSVSSTGSSAQSGSGASDWDDTVSVYSSTSASTPGSGPPTSFSSPHPPSLSLSSSVTGSPGSRRDSLSRSPPLLGSPPHSAGLPSTSSGMGIRLPNAPEIPTLNGHGLGAGLRTKPRSNTTGGVGMGMYYSPPPSAHHPGLHHSSSNSSLHSAHSAHGDAGAPLHASPSMLHAEVGSDLYRRGSLPDMHAAAGASNGWDDGMGMGMGGMGGLGLGMGVNVKEEPRAVLV